MKIFINTLIFLFLQLSFSNAQNYIFNFNQLSVQSDTSIKIFLLSENPSLLKYDEDQELLYIRNSFISYDEKFKRYFDPEKINHYQIKFSGKKKIDENQIFKGIFGFNKLVRSNWNWIFSKDYDSGNPFIIGDSSVGSSTFNGIYFNANYYNQIFSNSSIGAGLEYFVDEGLKQASPKPTSQHRNIKFTFGISLSPLKYLELAFAGKVEDKKEEISYKEDEGAVYKEVTLFKFRGLDFPIVVKKKTETRILYHNNYEFDADLILKPFNSFFIINRIQKGIEQAISKEEITNPTNQGYFQNDYLKIETKSEIELTNKLKTNLSLDYYKSDSWSKHPDFSSLMSEQNQSLTRLAGNISYKFDNKFNAYLGAGFGQFKFNLNDYYSNVDFNIISNMLSFQTGLRLKLLNSTSFETNFLIERYSPINSTEFFSNSGTYFLSYFKNDLDYFKTKFNRFKISLLLTMQLFSSEILISTDYIYLKSESDISWSNSHNRNIRSSIEYRVKVY